MEKITLKTVLTALSLCVAGESAAQTKLLLSTLLPVGHPFYTAKAAWAKDVAAATQGEVQVEFSPTSLAPGPGQLDMVQRGVADIAAQYVGTVPNRLPMLLVTELPGKVGTAQGMTRVLWETNERYFSKANQLQGLHLLATPVFPPQSFFCVKEGSFDIDQLKASKIAATLGMSAKQYGAITSGVVAGPVVRYFELVSKGIVDAFVAITPIEVMSYNLAPYTKCIIDFPELRTAASWAFVVNERKWNSISPEHRKAIMELSGSNFAPRLKAMDDAYDSAKKSMLDGGAKILNPNARTLAEVRKRWQPALDNEWLASATERGVNGAEAIRFYRERLGRAR